jgi:hypothetical protein
MPVLHIQGIDAHYRDLRKSSVSEEGELIEGEEILYADLPQKQQKFQRTEIPFTDDDIVAIVNKEHTYTALQTKWVEREKYRMEHGVYAMINGLLTFIPGSMYGYVNYWTLETGEKPDYRNCTRKIFVLKEYLLRPDVPVLAMTRGKSRRKGATTEGTFFEWWICGRNKEKIGGMVSYNDESIKKIFQMLFLRGFRAMLPCFVEDMDGSSDTYVKFIKSVEKKKKGANIKREGLNSFIDYQPTTLNSYDSGRVSYLLGDEWGKWEKVNVNTYWSKVKSCLRIGAKKVGFAYIPTTVNPKKKGGENYRKFWDAADQNAINPRTGMPYGIHTPSKVVRIFDSALEGYEGCIDEFGESVIDDPIMPVMGNDGNWITEGSRTKILRERDGLQSQELMDHRRDYPLDIFDMFAFEVGTCEFIEENFIDRIIHLEQNPTEAFWRQGRLYEEYDKEKKKVIVKWADDPKGECWSQGFPDEDNLYTDTNGTIEPLNGTMYSIGADTYKNIFAEAGSDGAISVVKKSCIVNGVETGLKPVFFFVGRPRLIKQFNRQMFLTCLFFGAKVNVEIDAGTWFYEDFLEWDALQCLEWTPAQDLTKPKQKILPGTQSGNPFELAKQLEVAKLYYDGNSQISYNGNVHRVTYIPLLKEGLQYNHSERTPYHLTVSFMMALLPILGRPRPRGGERPPTRPKQVLQTHKIKLPA